MVLEKLGNILKTAADKIASAVFVDKKLIDSIVKDLQRGLISSDINVALVKDITDKIRRESEKNIKGIEKKEQIIKLLYDQIKEILGGEKKELILEKKDSIMFLGLYGAGKTTTIAKLASYYSKRGKKVAMLGLDVHRPAAPEQLEQLAKKINLPVFIDKSEKDPIKIYNNFNEDLKEYDLILIDTAGRHNLDKELVKEIKELNKIIQPSHKILVMPADIGQAAKEQARQFQDSCDITGVIVTRMDSSAKGGGALTACHETNAPVFFITTGEHMVDLESFNPQSFISRLLGMGDLETLLDKVKSAVDEKQQKKLQKSLEEGKLTLLDVVEQTKSLGGMGGFSKIKDLIPGFSKVKDKIPEGKLENQEKRIQKWQHIVKSMTKQEIENPEILEKQTSRISRIAKGSGTTTTEVRSLLKQYKMLKEIAKTGSSMDMSSGTLSQKQMMKLAKKFGKKMRI